MKASGGTIGMGMACSYKNVFTLLETVLGSAGLRPATDNGVKDVAKVV